MAFTDYQSLLSLAGAITILGTSYLTVRKIARDAKKTKKESTAEILRAAQEADSELRSQMEAKIHDLNGKLHNLEISIDKDIKYLKDSYNIELKNLGEKIENLRTELSAQHSSLLALLTKLVENNKK